MPNYWIAIHHPDDYDPVAEDAAMSHAIDALNDEMVAAGVRVFVGGLRPPGQAKSVRAWAEGGVAVADGTYLNTGEHVAGFWVLNVADMAAATEWAKKAAVACRAAVEVRPFY